MTAVGLSPQQAGSLKSASVRSTRLALHRSIAEVPRLSGCLRVAELLEDPPDVLGRVKVVDLLQWIHRVGSSQARGILMHADELGPISELRRVGDLTQRQRYAIADHLYCAYRGELVLRPGARL
jgi:hypothetical protein